MSLPVSSPPPSQFSTTDSSETSNGFVVLGKDSHVESLQSFGSSQAEESPILDESRRTLQPGSTESQSQLIARVQNLTKENEELRCVLLQNNTLLQEYFNDLAGMQKSQKKTNETLQKGYDHARDVVKKLREKLATLKNELKLAQDRIAFLEEQIIAKEGASKEQGTTSDHEKGSESSEVVNLKKEVERLESEKDIMQANNNKLQEHISALKAIREAEPDIAIEENCETLRCVDSLVSLSSDMQSSLTDKLSSDQLSIEEMRDRLNKAITDKEILNVDFERLQIEKQQADQQLLQLQEEHAKVLSKMAELQEQKTQPVKSATEAREKESGDETKKQEALVNKSNVAVEVAELSHQVEMERERFTKLKDEVDLLIQEKETYRKKAEECYIKAESYMKMKTEFEALTQERAAFLKTGEELEKEIEKSAKLQQELDALMQEKEIGIKTVNEELRVEKEKTTKLMDELHVLKQEKETLTAKETEENKELVALKQQILELQNQTKHPAKTTNQQEAELIQELEKVKCQLKTEQENVARIQEELGTVKQDRDMYKAKNEEFETRLEEAGQSAEAFGLVEDPIMKEKMDQMKKQLWSYQTREGELLDKENYLLEKEESFKKMVEDKEKLELQLQEVLKKEQSLVQEARERDEELESLKTQLQLASTQVSDTQEQQMGLLRDELQKSGAELAEVQTREEHLRAQVLQLIRENESMEAELERALDEASQKDELYQTHLRKYADENENKRKQKDEVIAKLKGRLSTADGEIQQSQRLQEAYRKERDDIRAQHEQVVAEYNELLKSFQSTLNSNKQRQDDANEEYKQKFDKLNMELNMAGDMIRKKKEDCKLLEDELTALKEDVFDLSQKAEQVAILTAQIEVYQGDFRVEREAREEQHAEILRLQQELRHYREAEMDELNNTQMVEMQRRHGSYPSGTPESQGQNAGGWPDFISALYYTRGANERAGVPGGNEGQPPGAAQMATEQEEQQAPVQEEDWECPTCRNVFPDFNTLQMHALECVGSRADANRPARQPAQVQCPKCLLNFPDLDTLQIHLEECLD